MKLARKFLVAVLSIALTVMGLGVVTSMFVERSLHQQDLAREHRLLGHALAREVERLPVDRVPIEAPEILQAALPRRDTIRARLVSRSDPAFAPRHAALFDRALSAQEPVIAEEPEGLDVYVTIVPLVMPGMAVELEEPSADPRGLLRRILIRHFLLSFVLIAAFVVTITWMGRRFIGDPMKLLVSQAQRMGERRLDATTALQQGDEIGELARELDSAARRLREADERAHAENEKRLLAVEQLRHAERLATVGTLASGIAHELGTPLAVVQGRAALIEEATGSESDAAKSARVIVEQVHRMTRIIRQVLDFARRSTPATTRVPLSELTEKAVTLTSSMAKKSGVDVRIVETAPTLVRADPGLMHQVITNLLMNAVQASAGRAERVLVRVSEKRARRPNDADGEPARFGCVEIEDRGRGIAPDHLPHVFEPFFTTKDVGEGTGLGLSVSWGIVQDHDGWIDVESEVDRGSVFRVWLPCAGAIAERRADATPA